MDPRTFRTVGAALVLTAMWALGCHRQAPATADGDIATYHQAAARIAEASRTGHAAYRRVADLTDLFGPRMTGSPALERAIVWAHDAFVADGQENVTLDPVEVPIWQRGKESAEVVKPAPRRLAVLGLGGSVGTPPGGLTAEVAVVSSFDELKKAGADLRPAGVPLLGLFADPAHYFDVHHSVADTLEKIDPVALGRDVAAMATMAYVVADRPTRWPASPPPPPEHEP